MDEDGPIIGRARFDRGVYYDMTWYRPVRKRPELRHLEYRWRFFEVNGYHVSEALYNRGRVNC